MEPTGHYWLNLAYYLKHHQIRVVVVNPLHVQRTRELDDNSPTKNDVIQKLIYIEPNSFQERF
jgi:transposase